ncbi:OmpA family protein [Tenacibaculum sp. 190130A14a]
MGKKILCLGLLFLSFTGFGQKRYAADKYFEDYAYKKSAKLYEDIYNDGTTSYQVLSRLGDCYYFNSDFIEAEKWYTKLVDKYLSVLSPEYFFRYAQVLKSNGKIEESDKWLLKLNEVKKEDSRGQYLVNNQGYFSEYTNRKKTFINIHNLSTNTKYSDFGGFTFDDHFYFASTKPDDNNKKIYKWNNQPHLNIYKSEEVFNTETMILDLSSPEKINALSSKYHESSMVITKDGKTMYFTRTSFDGKKLKGGENKVANLKIYKAEKIGRMWGNIKELPFNNDSYSIGHPALSENEDILYFSSDMPNGFGGTDIYKVAILGENDYGQPINLGNEINTEGREMFPFIGSDGTMYFSSDGHLGLGALDVFEVKKEQNVYKGPINLGAPVNGAYDDFAFVINNEKNRGFFSSNRKNGKGDDDIYSFLIYQCKEDIKGFVTDSEDKTPIKEAIVKLVDKEGKIVAEKKTGREGEYTFYEIECNREFTVVAEKEDYDNSIIEIRTKETNEEEIIANFELKSLIVEDQIVINPIYFSFDKYEIRKDAAYELENVVAVMSNHPEMVIKIESHTDSRGLKDYNRWLSDMRAKATRDYIVSRGIAPERIESAIGYGEDQLLNDCNEARKECSEEEHQKNRRSYFYIIKGGKGVSVVGQNENK